MNQINVPALLDQMASELSTHYLIDDKIKAVHIVGIRTGGVWLAKELATRMGRHEDIGELNITFYRDDFTQIGLHPQVTPSSLPFSVEGADIILVDDVLMSGRTVRAAMNELFDYGRPASITLAVLIDLAQAQLPIKANVVGTQLNLNPNQRIKLLGPENLEVEIQDLAQSTDS